LDEAGRLGWYSDRASTGTGDNVNDAIERLAKLMLDARKVSE
jgi:hypothetical protein